MCGVVAYQSTEPKPEHFVSLVRLMSESKIRGLHSFGIAMQTGSTQGIKVWKSFDIQRLCSELFWGWRRGQSRQSCVDRSLPLFNLR